MSSIAQTHGRSVAFYFFLFFAMICVVDGIMVTIAIKTNPGIITDYPYEKGLAYNSVVEAEKAQQALGWKSTLLYNNKIVIFSIADASGKTIIPDSVNATFTRPMQAGMDFTVVMAPSKDGEFTANVTFPSKGLWEMRAYARMHDKSYQQSKRIVVE